jgi:hypothetical protein
VKLFLGGGSLVLFYDSSVGKGAFAQVEDCIGVPHGRLIERVMQGAALAHSYV